MRTTNKQLEANQKLIIGILGAIVALLGFILYLTLKIESKVEVISPLADTHSMQLVQEVYALEEPKETVLLEGIVSHYSNAGCLKCSESRTMANGQIFDENAMTLAVGIVEWHEVNGVTYGTPAIPLNTKVLVRNLDNGKEVIATVTDTGGFNTEKYGFRIADLSLGLANALEAKTDQSVIQILELQK